MRSLFAKLKYAARYLQISWQIYFGRNWWATIHIAAEETEQNFFTWRLRSFFGRPMITFFFGVAGPFHTEQEALGWIARRVAENNRRRRHAVPLALVNSERVS